MPPRRSHERSVAALEQLSKTTRRRRRRASEPYGLTVRVDLLDVRPPVWRRLVLPSTLRLDELHGVLQAVFAWEDAHLHRFSLGDTAWGDGEHFLCPFDMADGEDNGVPTSTVRLDEVLAAPGDRLLYTYDYGDEWRHQLVVESVGEHDDEVRLSGGRGVAPPEDSGGGWDEDDGSTDHGPFDADQVRTALGAWQRQRSVPPEIAQLLQRVAGTAAERVVLDLLEAADLSGPITVDETMARDTLRRYVWLLDRVGDGLALTAAGWLPPAVVTDTMNAVFPADRWIGKRNREDLTEPVRRLRSSAQRLGLLRVARGRLTATKAGVALRADPVGLWRHVADRLAVQPRDAFDRSAGALLLLSVAAGRVDLAALADVLHAAGWGVDGGGPVPPRAVVQHAATVDYVLGAADAYDRFAARGPVVSEGGRALARAVLTAG